MIIGTILKVFDGRGNPLTFHSIDDLYLSLTDSVNMQASFLIILDSSLSLFIGKSNAVFNRTSSLLYYEILIDLVVICKYSIFSIEF